MPAPSPAGTAKKGRAVPSSRVTVPFTESLPISPLNVAFLLADVRLTDDPVSGPTNHSMSPSGGASPSDRYTRTRRFADPADWSATIRNWSVTRAILP
jgi:hypothetical protein